MSFVLVTKFQKDIGSEFYLIEEKEFNDLFEIYRKDTTPNIYKDHHVRLNDKAKKLREEKFYYDQLLEVRSRWTPGEPLDIRVVGYYIWE